MIYLVVCSANSLIANMFYYLFNKYITSQLKHKSFVQVVTAHILTSPHGDFILGTNTIYLPIQKQLPHVPPRKRPTI
jgi:hypothetical protein